ncbi:MAG: type II toxin-antitoxin system PemK/MazF family toxin [Nitriliruptoraceae bacterium]
MRRGEVWLADVGHKPRPVLIITRDEVLDVRANVTVAEVTTQARGLAVEVPIDTDTGIHQPSVVNCDGLHTVSQRRLTQRLGSLDRESLAEVCGALAIALSCEPD